ncbi:hypothetical protein DS843_17860 [Roseomonas genomospecies 6]|uniref:Uncharacterized protein n=1 Tax=Roseomonas genomospecies 6 TaxID=214106 RepID=A0A9W7NHU3_9PROT|nr:hypothetical protein DS843_17860 [Roseomonas genomospecies 6]
MALGIESLSRPGRGCPRSGRVRVEPRIKALILGGTLTLPTLRAGPFPLPGRERGSPMRLSRLPPGQRSALLAYCLRETGGLYASCLTQ